MIDKKKMSDFSLESKFVHGYDGIDPLTGAVSFPIYQTSTYKNPALGSDIKYTYTRSGNPTRNELECAIALYEGGTDGFAFSTGLAAVLSVFSLLKSGDHVIISDDIYGGVHRLIEELWRDYGVEFDYVDIGDVDAVKKLVKKNTKMIYAETPTNPMMKVADIKALSEISKPIGAYLVVDNTFLTPYFQRPIELGADIVIHSATKYLAGHHDTMAGLVVVNDEKTADRIKLIQKTEGTGLAPFDCWLLLRGMKTLELRMKRHEENAIKIAEWLKNNKNVEKVYFVGLPEHPSYEVTKRQCSGFGGMLSFTLKDEKMVEKALCGYKMTMFAESLGGATTLITYPMTQTHNSVPEEVRNKLGITNKLIRLSVGIEPAEDIIKDLESVLGKNE